MVGALLGLAGTGLQAYTQIQQNKRLKEIMAKMEAPSKAALNQAQLERNARMPGAAQAEQNIFQSGANALGRMQQGATSSADIMQAAAGVQSQENQGFQNLAGQEGQYKAQANQAYLQALNSYQQQYNDYLQSQISAQSSLGQGQAAAFGAISGLGGGLMNNAAYLAGKEPGKSVNFFGTGYKK